MKSMVFSLGQRSVHLLKNVSLIRKLRDIIKHLITNFKKNDGCLFSPLQQQQFELLYQSQTILTEMLTIESINKCLFLPFFQITNKYKKMKDISFIIYDLLYILNQIDKQTNDGIFQFILTTFGLSPLISPFHKDWYNNNDNFNPHFELSKLAILLIVKIVFLKCDIKQAIIDSYPAIKFNQINVSRFSIHRSYYDELSLLNKAFMIGFLKVLICFYSDINKYLIQNADWQKYTNDKAIPECVPWNTDYIEREHGKVSTIFRKACNISDECLENRLMFQSNQTDKWLTDLKINYPKIYEIIEFEIKNDSMSHNQQKYNDFEKIRLEKQRNHIQKTLKRKQNIRRVVKRRKRNIEPAKVTEIEGFAIERPALDAPYIVLKESQYPKYDSLVESFYPDLKKWYLGKVTKIINKTKINVCYFIDQYVLTIDLKKAIQFNVIRQ